jgi:hypothetical protein
LDYGTLNVYCAGATRTSCKSICSDVDSTDVLCGPTSACADSVKYCVQSTDLNEEFVTITASESEVSDANAANAAANAEFKTLKETKAAEEAAHKAADQDEQDKWGSVVLVATVGVCVCIPMIGWVLRRRQEICHWNSGRAVAQFFWKPPPPP